MSKNEVEVKLKIPAQLDRLLRAENYFGLSPDEFFFEAAKSYLGSITGNMNLEEIEAFNKKHGKAAAELTVFYHPKDFDC